jgi:hypothetical protein
MLAWALIDIFVDPASAFDLWEAVRHPGTARDSVGQRGPASAPSRRKQIRPSF